MNSCRRRQPRVKSQRRRWKRPPGPNEGQGSQPPAGVGSEAQEQQPSVGSITPEPASTPKPKQKPKKKSKLPPELARISVRLTNVPLPTFLNAVSQQTLVNFIVSEGLEVKKITAFLDGVTLEEALQVLLGIKGLAYEKIPGKTNTYLISQRRETQPRTVTRIFELKYIPLQGMQATTVQGEGSVSSVDIELPPGESMPGGGNQGQGSPTQAGGDAGGLLNILKTVLSGYGRLAIDPRTNSLIITDLPERFAQLETIIRELDKKSPQVTLEAQIVEINSQGLQKLGVEFGGPNGEIMRFVGPSRYTDFLLRRSDADRGSGFWRKGNLVTDGISASAFNAPGAVSISAVDPTGGTTFGVLSLNEFQILLRAIVTKTRGKVLSRPKIMTLNNKPAEIRITANQAIGTQATVLGGGSGTTSVERQETGLVLKVTPQVNGDDYVTLLVEPKLTRVAASLVGGSVLDPVTRGVKSMVRVKNGDTIVVGGLIDTREEKVVRKVPLLGYIPLIGWLFTSESSQKTNSELAIFLTPTVMEN